MIKMDLRKIMFQSRIEMDEKKREPLKKVITEKLEWNITIKKLILNKFMSCNWEQYDNLNVSRT